MFHSHDNYILESNTKCTTVCCPTIKDQSVFPTEKLFKKEKKYITLTINKPKQPVKATPAQTPQPDSLAKPLSASSIPVSEQLFKQDKSSFLQQIRNYSPEPKQQNRQISFKSLDTTKELQSSRKTTLTTLLQSLSNEIFSEMFVSSAVKGKVVLSGELGSISEVRSEMQLSNPTEVFHSHILEQR